MAQFLDDSVSPRLGKTTRPGGALHGTGLGSPGSQPARQVVFAQIAPQERQVRMEPVAVICGQPALLDRALDGLLTREVRQSHSRFGARDGRIRRCVKVCAQRVQPANGNPLDRREIDVIDRQVVEPDK